MKTPNIIVIGTDFSPLAEVALETGFDLARRFRAARVHVVHILDQSFEADAIGETPDEWQRRIAEEKLETIHAPELVLTREIREGIPSRDLVSACEDVGADLVVVASAGLGVVRRALGSVASSLIRTSRCPVLVVGEDRRSTRFDTVVAGVVPSPVARAVVETAAAFTEGTLHLVSSLERPLVLEGDLLPRLVGKEDFVRWQSERMADLRALIPEGPTRVHLEALNKAPPANAILDSAQILGADLIVVGTSGRNFWHRMVVGSTATRVVAEARCPVLVIPAEAS